MTRYDITPHPHPPHPRWGTGKHPGFKDLTGQAFGRLTALHYCGSQVSDTGSRRYPIWACRCECGNELGVWSHSLTSGHTRSCGCLHAEVTSENNSAKLDGEVFGRLTVLGRIPGSPGEALWACDCVCGAAKIVSTDSLNSGRTRSCGCLQKEHRGTLARTHGLSGTSEYIVWKGMRARCLTKTNPAYPHYGGRGIIICDRWLGDFEAFLADMGPRPSLNHSIDRRDNDGNYEPGNCRWATASEQASNRRAHTYGRDRGDDGRFQNSKENAA